MPFLCSVSALSPFLFVPLPLVSSPRVVLFNHPPFPKPRTPSVPFCMLQFVQVSVCIQLTLANICIPVAMVSWPTDDMIFFFNYRFLKKKKKGLVDVRVIWGKPCSVRMEDSFCAHLGRARPRQSSALLEIISVFSFKRPWVTKGFCDCVIIQLLMS